MFEIAPTQYANGPPFENFWIRHWATALQKCFLLTTFVPWPNAELWWPMPVQNMGKQVNQYPDAWGPHIHGKWTSGMKPAWLPSADPLDLKCLSDILRLRHYPVNRLINKLLPVCMDSRNNVFTICHACVALEHLKKVQLGRNVNIECHVTISNVHWAILLHWWPWGTLRGRWSGPVIILKSWQYCIYVMRKPWIWCHGQMGTPWKWAPPSLKYQV